jgi:hypothetical protein
MLSTGLPERSQFSGSTAISFPRFDWPGTTSSRMFTIAHQLGASLLITNFVELRKAERRGPSCQR